MPTVSQVESNLIHTDGHDYGYDSYVYVSWKSSAHTKSHPSSPYRYTIDDHQRRVRFNELSVCWFFDPEEGCFCREEGRELEHGIGVWPYELPPRQPDEADILGKGKRKRAWDENGADYERRDSLWQ